MALKKYLAYTFLELLVTVAVIGGVSAGAYVVVQNTTQASAGAKLEQDVKVVNRALRVYQTHGGRIPPGVTGEQVLARLRREAANPQLPGLKGSLIDPRMTIRRQNSSEAASGGRRAYWNDTDQKFYIAESGSDLGVKEFYSGDMPVETTLDDREGFNEFAKLDNWVWDFDGDAQTGRPALDPEITGIMDPGDSDATAAADALPLGPPQFSSPPGTYPLSWFPTNLTLTHNATTPAGMAEIYSFKTGGSWGRYDAPFPLEPGMAVSAKSVSLHPDRFLDSSAVEAIYNTDAITLALGTTLRASYRYAELGGPLAPGSPAPVLAPTPTIFLSNADALPDQWENSSVFQSFWTWDGADPSASSAGRVSGLTYFSNTYPGEDITLTLTDFASSSSQTFSFVALSKNTKVANSSAVGTVTVSAQKTTLLPPVVTPGEGSIESGSAITMVVNTAGGQTPANARIFYRTDGVDPGEINGEPAVAASLYTGEFYLAPDTTPMIQVVARVYPPSDYKAWFNTSNSSTMTYYLPYANSNVYGVQGGNRSIYLINPSTGTNSVLDDRASFNLRALALDVALSRLYYIEEATSTAGWRLGYLDFITRNHKILGSLKTGWAYNASAQPQNLAFFNGALYYIHRSTDDLVRISLNAANDAIASVTKVADIRANASTFTEVGDIAIDDSGLMFFCDSGRKYWRFDLMTMSGTVQLGTCSRTFEGLAFFQARLFGTDNATTKVWRLTPNNGKDLSSVSFSPARDFIDLAAPTASAPVTPSNSMWAIVENTDGPHLVEFRNYRSPLISTAADYGAILYGSNSSFASTSGSGIRSLAVTSDGVAYFARNLSVSAASGTRTRPLFKLNVTNLNLGDVPVATFVGDLGPGLAAMAGTIDPDDVVSGLTFSPAGQLYGVLREGLSTGQSGADYLFRCTQTITAMTGPVLTTTACGRLTSSAGSSTHSEDLVFSRDGSLFVSDTSDSEVLRVNPVNGSILSVLSNDIGTDYRGLAVDNSDFRVIASNAGGSNAHKFVKVDGGQGNDDTYLDYNTRWGYQAIGAVSFYQAPFLPLSGATHLFAADGTPTIYAVDFATGQTVPVTDAPYPVRALAYDLNRRLVFYLEAAQLSFRIGSFSVDTFVHRDYGTLQNSSFTYYPSTLPDNLAFYSGYLWYVEPKTDNLVRVEVGDTGILSQVRASNMTANLLTFDLIGDLAISDDGWMYFSCNRTDGQRFCRFRIKTMSNFETLSGPIPPPVLLAEGGTYRENWFDALAFGPPNATGGRFLYGTYSSAPAPMRKVDLTTGDSVDYKMTTPAVNIIDFSDQHPGDITYGLTLKPQLAFTNVYPSYTYSDVGGPLLPGSIPAPAPAPAPVITLLNPNEFTLPQLSSTYFQIKWSADGSDPKTSSTARTGADFSNGFPGQAVDVSFSQWGMQSSIALRAVAKSQQETVLLDSSIIAQTVTSSQTVLRNPVITEGLAVAGVRQMQITPNIAAGDCPPGTRIFYTLNGTDPGVVTDASGLDNPVLGILYTGTIPVPNAELMITARVYPPVELPMWFKASNSDYYDVPYGLAGGHMDVDTSSMIYPFRKGTTDGHVHEYDKVHNAVGASFFSMISSNLENIQNKVPAGTKFKIIVSNADLSPGGRLVINNTYNPASPSTYTLVTAHDNTLTANLPIYSLDGQPGTIQLTQFGLYFDPQVIASGGLIPTVTGSVRNNDPGRLGEWRNGALTVQVVRVNPDGTDAFTTNTSYSNGGVQGVATSGLLWESTFFWHWGGGAYGL